MNNPYITHRPTASGSAHCGSTSGSVARSSSAALITCTECRASLVYPDQAVVQQYAAAHSPAATEDTCERCRLSSVQFTAEVQLPRFTVRPGEIMERAQVRFISGGLRVGGGVAPASSFFVLSPFSSRACGCDHRYSAS